MVHFHGEVANEEAQILLNELHVGGIIYYEWANGLHSPEQVRALSTSLQEMTDHPLLLAVDQEGGRVTRLKKGFTNPGDNYTIGQSNDPCLAEKAAYTIGQELRDVGINLNLAPVVDIACDPAHSSIGNRSFGSTATQVVRYAKSALDGFHRAGVATTLKHFPGHGDVEIDSHERLPILSKSLAQLEAVELVPFAELHKQTECIMTAHILVPALDPNACATLSPSILSYLRKTLGFQGVIISDSLIMDGVLRQCGTVEEAAIQALNAGCDILLLGGKLLQGEGFELTVEDARRIHHALVQAVHEGRISQARLNEALERVDRLTVAASCF
jgi:beta-N-acetylhexosaminidase